MHLKWWTQHRMTNGCRNQTANFACYTSRVQFNSLVIYNGCIWNNEIQNVWTVLTVQIDGTVW
jgi:hypothetical protein